MQHTINPLTALTSEGLAPSSAGPISPVVDGRYADRQSRPSDRVESTTQAGGRPEPCAVAGSAPVVRVRAGSCRHPSKHRFITPFPRYFAQFRGSRLPPISITCICLMP